MEQTILVVDDEEPIVDILRFNLKKEGYKVLEAYDGEMAIKIALESNPDLILLDVMLPKMDGFTVCKKLRERLSTPILMITAREEEVDKVLGLAIGADDYITKPFSIKELMARVKANLRRGTSDLAYLGTNPETASITQGLLEINIERYEVKKNKQPLELTLREFELLKFLALQPEKIFSREALLEKVWGYEYYGDVRTVDVTIRRLREKIEDDASNPKYVVTRRGVGYFFAKQYTPTE
ncbi:MAG: response regulator transcription factor [Clostridiaceae bacterium]|nr:response regulator transcription factor [Clostridiaceae bacterium]